MSDPQLRHTRGNIEMVPAAPLFDDQHIQGQN